MEGSCGEVWRQDYVENRSKSATNDRLGLGDVKSADDPPR
jgi:hypothetical protein